MEYTGGNDNDIEAGVKTSLQGNGDFRNEECIELLKEADIVVTNEPFSLTRQFLAQLLEYDKKFLIICNKNAITYKEIFPLLKDNKIWLGYTSPKEFDTPDGKTKKVAGLCRWFTNLDIPKRHEKLILWRKYYDYYNEDGTLKEGKEDMYPRYDNYDAINVDKVSDIPEDYDGVMGVPITFLDNFSPEQVELLGGSMFDDSPCLIIKNYVELGFKFLKEDGIHNSTSGALKDKMSPKIPYKGKGDYSLSLDNKKYSVAYQRIFIKSKSSKNSKQKELALNIKNSVIMIGTIIKQMESILKYAKSNKQFEDAFVAIYISMQNFVFTETYKFFDTSGNGAKENNIYSLIKFIEKDNKKYHKELSTYKELISFIKNERNSHFAHSINADSNKLFKINKIKEINNLLQCIAKICCDANEELFENTYVSNARDFDDWCYMSIEAISEVSNLNTSLFTNNISKEEYFKNLEHFIEGHKIEETHNEIHRREN